MLLSLSIWRMVRQSTDTGNTRFTGRQSDFNEDNRMTHESERGEQCTHHWLMNTEYMIRYMFVYTSVHASIHSPSIHQCLPSMVHTPTHPYTYIRIHTNTYTYLHIHTYTYMHIHMHMHILIHIDLHIYVHVFIYIFIYIHIHIL